MAEAPEGIVAYSWSGIPPDSINIFASQWDGGVYKTSQYIKNGLSNGSIVLSQNNNYIDYTDVLGDKYIETEKLVLTNTFIETLDLINEGMIEGPVSGEYINSGNLGQTGWTTSVFSGYTIPTGYDSFSESWSGSRWLRSIYLNQVPILSDKGQFNFQSIPVRWTPGLPNGANLESLISEETTSRSIGEILRFNFDKYYRILNKNCKGVIVNIKIPALSYTPTTNPPGTPRIGDVLRTRVDWQISYRPIFSDINKQSDFSETFIETVFGKISAAGGYVRSTRINFNVSSFFSKQTTVDNPSSPNPITSTVITPNYVGNFLNNPDFLGWEIKITRITDDSISVYKQDQTYVDSLTELYGDVFLYPNSAIIKSEFDAEFFVSIPERAFECNLLKVNIPGNYDPIKRTYSGAGFATTNGFWNGEFASGKSYTNNPAWCFYDLVTNKRYGLGRFVDGLQVDKFTLYKIGQYCDELVADGEGGLEPRFTCNTWITSQEDAFNVVNDLATLFRGVVYYTNGNLFTVQDSPKIAKTTFTNANVEEGNFTYSSTSKKERKSIAIVSYNNPRDFYNQAIEYVEDINSIRKYGIRELNLTAFGCTSRGQAIRLGRWSLLSSNVENETVQFVAGLEAAGPLYPGDVFKVVDYNRKGKRYAGRVLQLNDLITGANVTLDSVVELETGTEYKLSLLTPSYFYNTTQISGLDAGDYSNINRVFLQDIIFTGKQAYTGSLNTTVIGLTTGFNTTDYSISGNPIFSIELTSNSASYSGARYFFDSDYDYYKVINSKEIDVNKYEIVGLQYWQGKFGQIDSGVSLERTRLPSSVSRIPATPSDLSLNLYELNNATNDFIIHYAFLVDNYNYINNYRVYASTGSFGAGLPSSSDLIAILPSDVTQSTYPPLHSGTYSFRVYSYNESDNLYSAGYASNSIFINKDLDITNVTISSLQVV